MPQVFISYSRKDLTFVERLSEDLKAAGLEVWYDLYGLEGGSRWSVEIQNAIQQSQIFVVVLSPNSISSEWVEKEFIYADSLKREIIPLRYRPCETPAWFSNPHFIDVQGSSYENHFWVILRLMGIQALEKANSDKLPVGATLLEPAVLNQTDLPLPEESEANKPVPVGRKIRIVPLFMAALLGLVAMFAFAIWGMPALAAHLAPGPTPTPTASQIPTAILKPEPTSTPLPTPTLVPSSTFTALPTQDPATGTVTGSTGWNSQPFAGVIVKLCTNWLYTCTGTEFSAVTNADGEFTISGVSPGKYQVITKYPGQNDETRLQSFLNQAGSPLVVAVSAGGVTTLDPIAICKVDLVLFAPSINGNSVTFSWKAYPDTSTYAFFIVNQDIGSWSVPSTTYSATLPAGNYQWRVVTNGSNCSQGIGNFSVP